MKKNHLTAITAALLAVLAVAVVTLAACKPASFNGSTDDVGVHVVAEDGASDTYTGEITIGEGYGIVVNHVVDKGSFHVTIVDDSGATVFDGDIIDNICDNIDVQGHFTATITANKATGWVDVQAYDKEAQAMADATMPNVLTGEGVTDEAVENADETIAEAEASAEGEEAADASK